MSMSSRSPRVTPPSGMTSARRRPPTPPSSGAPAPLSGPGSGGPGSGPRARRVRRSHDDVMLDQLVAEQCVAPGLAHAIASHEKQRSTRRPPRRMSADEVGPSPQRGSAGGSPLLPAIGVKKSPGKRSRRHSADDVLVEGRRSSASASAVPTWDGDHLQLDDDDERPRRLRDGAALHARSRRRGADAEPAAVAEAAAVVAKPAQGC